MRADKKKLLNNLENNCDGWDPNANGGRGGLKKGYNLAYSKDENGRISLSVESDRGDVIHQVKADERNQEGPWENLGTGFEGRLREGYNASLEPIPGVETGQLKSDTQTLTDGTVIDPKIRPGDPGYIISEPKVTQIRLAQHQ